ncbi:MAG TPA: manganese efflux pump [Gaiellaceae bacterium]|nr:manganese efflux pump [Gaiellaceae bacterium]
MLKLILFVFPLAFDTFAVSAALGAGGLRKQQRLKIGLLLSSFEMGMPVIGLLLGHGFGSVMGGAAGYIAAGALFALGASMLAGDKSADGEHVAALVSNHGLALLGLGISVSLDELAMGFTIGLLHLSIIGAVILIGAQAFVVAQVGMRLGSKLGEVARAGAEYIAALALIGLGFLVLADKVVS